MPDGSIMGYKVLLLLASGLVVFALAFVIARRRPKRDESGVDWLAHYRRARRQCIASGILAGLQTVLTIHGHDRTWLMICAGGALVFVISLAEFFQARKKVIHSPELARELWQHRKPLPPFFWQAVFILLPVAVMAGLGLYSLRQDRLLAEQEARQNGQVLAEQLAQAISIEASQSLLDYYNANFEMEANRTADLGLSQWAGGATSESNAWKHIKAWQLAHPEINLSVMPQATPGSYVEAQPETMPPQPPEWLGQLNAGQQRLWDLARQLEFVAKDFPAAQETLEKFIVSKPPPGARANAEYLLLEAKAHGLSSEEAANLFVSSSWSQSDQVTEAGLPVGQLIWYRYLCLQPAGAGFTRKGIGSIAWAITYRPSFFSSRLLPEVERVSKGTVFEKDAATLQAWCNANENARMVREDFCAQYPTNSWAPAPFWVNSRIGKFLLLLGDRRPAFTNNMATIQNYNYLLFPQAVVEKTLGAVLAKSDISLPPYSLVEFEMAGKKIVLPGSGNPATTNAIFPLLGQAGGMWKNPPAADGLYPFVVRVSLASPEILYARQRQRTWLFGALILGSVVAAMLGLFAAWRSFRREQQLNEQKSNFVSSVSHELRAPIASVRLMAENLERGKVPEPVRQGEYFRFIVQECRRLSSLIENVLDFSRIEQGRKQYEFEPTDLIALVDTTVKLMEPYAAEKGVHLEFNSALRAPHAALTLDGRAIQQALVNLIDNAVKHSTKGETVAVGVEVRNLDHSHSSILHPLLALWVADHGPGIPRGEHEKIFERFYRLGSELRRETQGVGIGLSVVKHIVEAHGGRVRVKSDVGKGSRFTIELPLTTNGE